MANITAVLAEEFRDTGFDTPEFIKHVGGLDFYRDGGRHWGVLRILDIESRQSLQLRTWKDGIRRHDRIGDSVLTLFDPRLAHAKSIGRLISPGPVDNATITDSTLLVHPELEGPIHQVCDETGHNLTVIRHPGILRTSYGQSSEPDLPLAS